MQIGMSAPQGSGKTTIVTELEKLFPEYKLRCASISIDDFYLSNAAQRKVSDANPENRLVQGRGVAGTHDLQLGSSTLDQLTSLGCASRTLKTT
jgi:D-glycerate 3-kinase